MRFLNLFWAIRESGCNNYQVAAAIGVGESRFSRALRGLTEFTAEEKAHLASLLNYPAKWLFQEVVPPTSQDEAGRLEGSAACPATRGA